MTAKLYVVATPIGNLADMTYRAVRILSEVDTVLCEDTRVTGKLLHHYEIKKPMVSYHANSKLSRTEQIMDMLREGRDLALVSDAGTPTISDPGVQLVQMIVTEKLDVEVIAVPGASAIVAGLSVAGLAGNQFTFYGFLPHKKGRQTLFAEIAENKRVSVFYESPHRIEKTLDALSGVLSDEQMVVIGRELTKMHEQVVRGSIGEVKTYFEENQDKVRGEFVVMIEAK